jgi:hypothetical protein
MHSSLSSGGRRSRIGCRRENRDIQAQRQQVTKQGRKRGKALGKKECGVVRFLFFILIWCWLWYDELSSKGQKR